MTNVLIIQGDELEQFYERTLQYLYEKYHTYPDNLPQLPMSGATDAQMTQFQVLAEQRFQQAMNRDPRYDGRGLRRR